MNRDKGNMKTITSLLPILTLAVMVPALACSTNTGAMETRIVELELQITSLEEQASRNEGLLLERIEFYDNSMGVYDENIEQFEATLIRLGRTIDAFNQSKGIYEDRIGVMDDAILEYYQLQEAYAELQASTDAVLIAFNERITRNEEAIADMSGGN